MGCRTIVTVVQEQLLKVRALTLKPDGYLLLIQTLIPSLILRETWTNLSVTSNDLLTKRFHRHLSSGKLKEELDSTHPGVLRQVVFWFSTALISKMSTLSIHLWGTRLKKLTGAKLTLKTGESSTTILLPHALVILPGFKATRVEAGPT